MHDPQLVSGTAHGDVVPLLDKLEGTLTRGAQRSFFGRTVNHGKKHDVALVTLKFGGDTSLNTTFLDFDAINLFMKHRMNVSRLLFLEHGDYANRLVGIGRMMCHRLYECDDFLSLSLVDVTVAYPIHSARHTRRFGTARIGFPERTNLALVGKLVAESDDLR